MILRVYDFPPSSAHLFLVQIRDPGEKGIKPEAQQKGKRLLRKEY
jgi:hypothetical protein